MSLSTDPASDQAHYAHPNKIVTPSWLSARLGTSGLRVVESDEDTMLYNIGHIPGAVSIDWARDLNDPVTRDFIDGERFAALMKAKGISRDDTVVIYGDTANWWAAYTLWVFELFGHPDVRLLDGGRDAWMAEERDTSFDLPMYPPTEYPVVERADADLRAFYHEVRGAIGSDVQIVDARDHADYAGTRAPVFTAKGSYEMQRPGHIPGAINIPWEHATQPNAYFLSAADTAAYFSQLDTRRPVIVYCFLGARSAHTWFILRYLLGFTDVRVYDGSWTEWGNLVQAPIERELC
ncbi:sulfurtransferase [Corynebacterium uterequi]|uniref:Sulfurtransferase n=1 Tax=Corynebacterium uterequi TaxID=1072256 RepID=A0A0G3HCQ9_9CORY|nr:sulfurtransferase [Corynebacterium uterequi]AKK10500.1 rhodanese-related sulfurtransferase [Corynebacterium uterequi]